jgi:hypothetical protein
MHATRKSDLKSFTPTPRDVCRIEDGSSNSYLRHERAIEGFLKTIEPRYNAATRKLVNEKVDAETIYTISGFVACVMSCSPAGMRIQSHPLKDSLEETAAVLEAQGLIPPPPPALGGTSLTELLRSGAVIFQIDPKYPQAVGISSILPQVALFGNFKWDILRNGFDETPFFTSDFPVAIEETENQLILNRIVPLAPNLAVRIRPDPSIEKSCADFSFSNFDYRTRDLSRAEVVEINRLIVRCAEDAVFYRDNAAWVQKFLASNRDDRIELRSRQVLVDTGSPSDVDPDDCAVPFRTGGGRISARNTPSTLAIW